MYAWKCWRETRNRFYIALIIVTVVAAGTVITPMLRLHNGHWLLDRNEYARQPVLMAHLMTQVFLGSLAGLWVAWGVLLGSTSVGSEWENGTAEYLLTRPRPRNWFTWVHWGVCAAELMVLVAAPSLLTAVALTGLTGYWKHWVLLAAPPVVLLVALPILGLTVLMTAIRRSAQGGLLFTAGIVLGYLVLVDRIQNYWHIQIPPLSTPLLKWLALFSSANQISFPYGALARAVFLSLAFVILAQKVLRRAEL